MKIVLLGSGRLAWNLGPALQKAGATILQVYSRSASHATSLAKQLDVGSTDQISQLVELADLYLIAVADDVIGAVSKELSEHLTAEASVVHTSGATPGKALEPFFKNYGVFYPLQSFTKEKLVDFTEVPICIDANQTHLQSILKKLAKTISKEVYSLNDQQRAQLHLAAVFANNFINHLIGISHELLAEADISKNILQNMIRETVLKLESGNAEDLQTGPAIRGDWDTLARHEKLLSKQENILELYQKISDSIIKRKKR